MENNNQEAAFNYGGIFMAKIIAICGKICCGKTYYANQIKEKEKAKATCNETLKSLNEKYYNAIKDSNKFTKAVYKISKGL